MNLKNIKFNNDPLELRNQESISVITMNELIKDKSINPYSVDVLAKNISEGNELKKQLSDLDEIKDVTFFEDLIPQNQDVKLEILNQFKTFFPEIDLNEAIAPKHNNIRRKENELFKSIEDKVNEKYKSMIDISYIDKLKDRKYSEDIFYFFRENIKKFNKSLKAQKISEKNIPDSLKTRYVGKNGKIRLEIVPFQNLNDQTNKKDLLKSYMKLHPMFLEVHLQLMKQVKQ